jgi:hypothetical protein
MLSSSSNIKTCKANQGEQARRRYEIERRNLLISDLTEVMRADVLRQEMR